MPNSVFNGENNKDPIEIIITVQDIIWQEVLWLDFLLLYL